MKRHLPVRPSLAQLKHQAKDLLKQFRANADDATLRFREYHPQTPQPAVALLSDAQLVMAREYDFASWPKLKHHVEGLESVENRVARLQAEFSAGDLETKQRLLPPAHTAKRFETTIRERPPSLTRMPTCSLRIKRDTPFGKSMKAIFILIPPYKASLPLYAPETCGRCAKFCTLSPPRQIRTGSLASLSPGRSRTIPFRSSALRKQYSDRPINRATSTKS